LTNFRPVRAICRQGDAVAAALMAVLLPFSAPLAAEGLNDRISGATGGILRSPNDLQPENDGNLFGEAWAKFAFSLMKTEKTDTALFVLGNGVADSQGFSYNNTVKIGVGLSHSIQFNESLNVTLSGRYDWYKQSATGERREGLRLATNYYFYRRWEAAPDDRMLGLKRTATVLKSYGTLAYPGSLVDGDNNLVLTLGGELSADLDLPATEWILTPFADFDFAWDKDQNNYNNKFVTGIGAKLRYPLEKGEIFAGVRFSSDYRWIDRTFDTGPVAYVGWYKGF
jgi:hypothetical protein